MDDKNFLAEQFEAHRNHLRGVAYRMLGSLNEADDAVQESWLRLNRSDATEIENLNSWLTTVVARVCLDMLRSRKLRNKRYFDELKPDAASSQGGNDPEQEAVLADSVGIALLVVLETLNPAERLAFVLHEMFDVSFEEIGSIVGRTPTAARKLASRARHRLRGIENISDPDLQTQRKVIDAFLAALRAGDFDGLVAVLDPNVVFRADAVASSLPSGRAIEVRGARNCARGAVTYSRGAQFVQPLLLNGTVGLVFAPGGRLLRALTFVFAGEKIVQVDIIGDQQRLREFDLRLY
jgi:RNA polymerase sigma-70 factor (ECF subfamily)